MKLGIIAMAALLVVGVLAVEGVASETFDGGLVTGSAEASCTEIDGQCVWICPPQLDKYGIYCLM